MLWQLESWIRQTIQLAADHPRSILISHTGKRLDIIDVIHSLKKEFRTLKLTSGTEYLKATPSVSPLDLKTMIDLLRIHFNHSKHVRRAGYIFGVDLLSVGQSAIIVRSSLLLLHGPSCLLTDSPPRGIARFPKLEKYWLSRLYFAKCNSTSAIDQALLNEIRNVATLEFSNPMVVNRSVAISNITMECLPNIARISLGRYFREDVLMSEDAFRDWLSIHKRENDFYNLRPIRNSESVENLTHLVLRDVFNRQVVSDPTKRRHQSSLLDIPEGDEPARIIELLQQQSRLLTTIVSATDPGLKASAHDVLALLYCTVEIMVTLGWSGRSSHLRALKKFDAFINIYTEHIQAIEHLAMSEDELGIVADIVRIDCGVILVDIDFDAFPELKFVTVNVWYATEGTGILQRKVRKALEEGAGIILIEVPREPEKRESIKLITESESYPFQWLTLQVQGSLQADLR
jgi:hypothetical protein